MVCVVKLSSNLQSRGQPTSLVLKLGRSRGKILRWSHQQNNSNAFQWIGQPIESVIVCHKIQTNKAGYHYCTLPFILRGVPFGLAVAGEQLKLFLALRCDDTQSD